MKRPAVEVKNLSKFYRIGHNMEPEYSTIRDTIIGLAKKPVELFTGQPQQYETFKALDNVSFTVAPGEVVGLIGQNGSGKSTLLKILSRIVAPSEGTIRMHGKVASLLEVGTGFHPELTGRENVYFNGAILGMKKREIDRKFDEIVAFSEVEQFLDTPVKFYSSGMYVRLAFAVAAHLEPDILIVDEVLAVGDLAFQKKSLGKMKSAAAEGRTVLFVSHSMSAVQSLCTKAILFEHGKIAMQGPVESAVMKYMGMTPDAEKVYESGPVNKASIEQEGDHLVLRVEYALAEPIAKPVLGFMISDAFGNKISGTNTRISKYDFPFEKTSSGTIEAVIRQPKFNDGNYSCSIWLGNGTKDFFADEHALFFPVNGMTRQSGPAASIGLVTSDAVWSAKDFAASSKAQVG
jgi:lipopolysaccharide transport system ATP-binding protein